MKLKLAIPLLSAFFSIFSCIQAGQVLASDPSALSDALSSTAVEEYHFETQVNKVMDIIIHSLYKTKGIKVGYLTKSISS